MKPAIIVGLFLGASTPASVLAAQRTPDSAPPEPRPAVRPVVDTAWLQARDEAPTTADELLQALRGTRPIDDLIHPVGATPGSERTPRPVLLPEGTSIVSRPGWLQREEPWWTFQFDPPDTSPPLKLLPNANLETMVRTARGSNTPVKFVLSGEVTTFRGENFVIARGVSRFVESTPPAPPPAGELDRTTYPRPSHPDHPQAGRTAVPTGSQEGHPPSGPALPGDAPVADVLRQLRGRQPETPMPIAPPPTEPVPGRRAAASRSLKADGTPLVRRPGRVIQEGDWWTLVFESDHPQEPEPPVKVLPSQGLQRMVDAAEKENAGLVFLISGEVTLFEDENYLLPRMFTRQMDTGNLTK